ncbi:transcription factor grauzone-like [Sabethes cyaneus]|uniref:transcription factor grauzone-like n=1 Tax=Sabethes cyaneus TaxID=53552 RepID=UPI00237EBB7D|nr:transcription factor grauzone-like [Sabethes cyaneus]
MDSDTLLSDCFTCMRRTDNYLRICDDSNTEAVDRILARHFWFDENEFKLAVLCTSCWEKIDDFNKFYCKVAELHNWEFESKVDIKEEAGNNGTLFCVSATVSGKRGRKRKWPPVEKSEPDEIESTEEFIHVPMKMEVETDQQEQVEERNIFPVEDEQLKQECDDEEAEGSSHDENDNQNDANFEEDDQDEEDSEEESSRPLASRTRRTASKAGGSRRRLRKSVSGAEKDALIKKHWDKLSCVLCSELYTTFTLLEKHCHKQHNTLPEVVCCSRKYQRQVNLYEHLRRHKSLHKFYCKDCDRSFKNVDGLAMHNMLNHTPEEEKKFHCQQCGKAFAAEILLTSHLNWHATVEPKNIVCEKCNKYFTNSKRLEEHLITHHPEQMSAVEGIPADAGNGLHHQDEQSETEGEGAPLECSIRKPCEPLKPFHRKSPEELAKEDELIRKYCTLNCEKCSFSAETFSKLEVHYKHAHDERRGYATCCFRKFSKRSRLFEHVCVHENPDHFKCEICAKTFQNSFGLTNHMMWKHTPDSEKPFNCDICGSRFWKDYLLKQHMEYHLALEEKKFACKECDRYFGTNLLLKSHEQTVHGLSASWVCDICAKGYPLKSALEFHRQQHTQEGRAAMKAQCEYCHVWLKNNRSLQSHRKRCRSTPVRCDVCAKECSNTQSLQSHKRFVHSGGPRFSCSFCAKPFKRMLRLKEHEAGHTGELLYKCEYCPRTCNSSSNMYTHKKVAHPEQWAEKMTRRFHQR